MSTLQPTSTGSANPIPSTPQEKKAWKAAQDFEAILLRQIFQSMRKASATLSDSDQESGADNQMQDFAWDGLADQASTHGGMGLAKMLYPKLLGQDTSGYPTLDQPALPSVSKATNAYSSSGKARPTSLEPMIQKAAADSGLDPDLIRAVIHTESGGNTSARSSKGALGPMQLMPATAAELGVDPKDPLQNILGGSRYLAALKKQFGDDKLALAAYNAGPGAVERHGGIPPYPETRAYVQKVLGTRQKLKEAP